MRLKLESDGTPLGTQVIDLNTGNVINGILNVKYIKHHDALSLLELTFLCAEASVQLKESLEYHDRLNQVVVVDTIFKHPVQDITKSEINISPTQLSFQISTTSFILSGRQDF